jgi:hypothetical protein
MRPKRMESQRNVNIATQARLELFSWFSNARTVLLESIGSDQSGEIALLRAVDTVVEVGGIGFATRAPRPVLFALDSATIRLKPHAGLPYSFSLAN